MQFALGQGLGPFLNPLLQGGVEGPDLFQVSCKQIDRQAEEQAHKTAQAQNP